MHTLAVAWGRLIDVLLPRCCVACGGMVEDEGGLCAACSDALPWNLSPCARCAVPWPSDRPPCTGCLQLPAGIDHVHAPLNYAFPVDRLVPRLKFAGDLAAGRELSALLLASLRDGERPDALVPVPLHRSRLATRGYDQALELARPLAAGLDVELVSDALYRRRATVAQTELGGRARRRNLGEAFAVRGPVPPHVALVDDVMTTGSTLSECAQMLRAAGARRVDAWVVARAAVPRSG